MLQTACHSNQSLEIDRFSLFVPGSSNNSAHGDHPVLQESETSTSANQVLFCNVPNQTGRRIQRHCWKSSAIGRIHCNSAGLLRKKHLDDLRARFDNSLLGSLVNHPDSPEEFPQSMDNLISTTSPVSYPWSPFRFRASLRIIAPLVTIFLDNPVMEIGKRSDFESWGGFDER